MLKPKYIWRQLEQEADKIKKMVDRHSISPLTAKLLLNRKVTEPEAVRRFLDPSLERFHDPYLLKGMKQAVERLVEAKEDKQQVVIYGDYDVDGITSTSVLYLFLKEAGFQVEYYIPDRLEEGYGINKEACAKLKESGKDLMISVDTGITAVDEVAYCNEIGLDVIITDHHEPQETLPPAVAVIDPKREDCPYPFKELAGVGVTFKVVQALKTALGYEGNIVKYLDIVAVGTVADIVPLVDENRIIVRHAFNTIPKTWNLGLEALLEVAGFEPDQDMTSGIIGFRVGPRLNAAGRLGDAKRGVQLFITEDPKEAANIAKALNDENARRQELEQVIYDQAVELIENDPTTDDKKIIVVACEEWHHGVIGIVSSRITEKYYKPSIILCVEDGRASGSARSVEGFSIFDALYNCKDLMDKFGGHEMAAGMSLPHDKVEELSQRLNEYAQEHMTKETLIPKLKIDDEVKEKAIDLALLDQINDLRPYGMGNPEPVFKIETSIKDHRIIGKDKTHLKVTLGESGLDGIGFGMAEKSQSFYKDLGCRVVGKLDKNEWRGVVKPQVMLRDMETFERVLTEHVPTREDFVMLYKILVNYHKLYGNRLTLQVLLSKLFDKYQYNSNETRILNCIKIFEEIGLLSYELKGQIMTYELHQGKKVDLESSKIYQELKEKEERD